MDNSKTLDGEEGTITEGEARYRAIFNAAAVSFWEYDFTEAFSITTRLQKDGVSDLGAYFKGNTDAAARLISSIKLLHVNETALRLYGARTEEELIAAFGEHHTSDSYRVFIDCAVAIAGGARSYERETTNRTLDGRDIIVLLSITLLDSAPSHKIALVTASDITDRKRLEEHLQIRERMDSIGTLAGGIAHDFNNLLAGIMGNLELLRMDNHEFSLIQSEYLDESLQLCQRAARLVKDFQSLSKRDVSEITSVDVHELAHEVFSMLSRTTDRLVEKRIDFSPGKFYVLGRHDQLHQVFLNLGTNAIQAIEEKGVRPGDHISMAAELFSLDDARRRGFPARPYAHFMFLDTGTGMTEEAKRHAFDPLFTTKKRGTQKGQGLGLAMVYSVIVHDHKGFIEIETEEGSGTIFHIFLPMSNTRTPTRSSEAPRIDGGSETILIIEDEESISKLVKRSLTKIGYSVLAASDGQAGLELYREKHEAIDLVILDLTLPKMSGTMVLDGIIDICPNAKVVISSGQSKKDIIVHTKAKGFVAKPYRLADLAEKVRKVLDD